MSLKFLTPLDSIFIHKVNQILEINQTKTNIKITKRSLQK